MNLFRCHFPRNRRILAWSILGFLGIQVLLNLFLEVFYPEIYDPEYRDRLSLLQQRLKEQPDEPLLLVVGSSRIVSDFRPEVLPPLQTSDGRQTLAINFSHLNAGPLVNLLEVERLLRRGIRPDWMVVESKGR